MNLILFKYGLPVLLGYILFVGIAGRFNPLAKPALLEERPSWMLGLWTGLSASIVMVIGLHMAYGMSLEGARALFAPSAWLLAGLLLPGFCGYFMYRSVIKREVNNRDHSDATLALPENILSALDTAEFTEGNPLDVSLENSDLDTIKFSDSADSPELPILESSSDVFPDDPELDSSVVADDSDDELISDIPDALAAPQAQETNELQEARNSAQPLTATDNSDLMSTEEAEAEIASLRQNLDTERSLRDETENHLRITRKALYTLESESREIENAKSDVVISLEEELESRIKQTSAAESRSTREEALRISAETRIVELKQDLVKAKQAVRLSTAARAKALGTANKSVAFARQAIQTRARLEADLKESKVALKNRQATISSLIRALEKEKRRTQDDVAAKAKQLVLHEKQLHARRSLEEVARSVEGKLTTRLVKKVAKARPLASGG